MTDLTPTEQEADRNAAEARAALGLERPDVREAYRAYAAEIGDSLVDLSRDIRRFLTDTIQATPEAQARKCAKEAAEFAQDPSVAEAADVLITLIGWCELRNVAASVLLDAATRKMTTNLTRTWQQQSDGTWQHVDGGVQ